jgi:hypothetical protein
VKIISLILIMISVAVADIALVSVKDIKYKQHIEYGDLKKVYIDKQIRCTMFDKNKLLENKYRAKRYILKGKPICNKDVEIAKIDKISFDFGNIVIERDGKVVGETKRYIRVKNTDGSVDKIYKNGQNR